MRYVVLGGGIASLSCVKGIRQKDSSSSIFLVSKEKYPPYRRPMITSVLEGKISLEDILLLDGSPLPHLNVTLMLGQAAEGIDVQNRVLFLQSKERLEYDKLLIATGAKPKLPPIPGIGLKGIYPFREYEHVNSIMKALPDAKSILIVGAGAAGIKVATSLVKFNKQVSMVEMTDQVLPNILDKTASEMMILRLNQSGINVILSDQVVEFEGKEHVTGAILQNSGRINADIVILTIGVSPAMDFLEGSGIEYSKGIIVNSFLESNVEGVYAAGDVIQFKEVSSGLTTVTPIWPEAVCQGEIAGLNMVGSNISYKGCLRRNVIQVHDTDFLSIGLVEPKRDLQTSISSLDLSRSGLQKDFYRKIVLEGSRLKGIVMVNNITYGGFFAELIRNQVELEIDIEDLLDPGCEEEILPRLLCREFRA